MHHPNMRLWDWLRTELPSLGSITYGFCVSPYVVSTNIGQELADFTPKVEAILNEVGNLKGTVLRLAMKPLT